MMPSLRLPIMNKPCRVCGNRFEPKPWNVKKRDWICGDCNRKWKAEWRVQRRSQGLPASGTKMPREWHQEYGATYYQRPLVKVRRAEQAKERRKHPLEQTKSLARRIVRSALERGELERQPCEVCGHVKVDAHHEDYLWPLEIRWLCRQHHTDLHRKAEGK